MTPEQQMPVGRILYYAHLQNSTSPSLKKKRIFLTITGGDDKTVLANQGLASLRQARMLRLCREAHDQGALLAYEDLTDLLLTSPSTIKRDLRLLRKQGLFIPIHRKRRISIKVPNAAE